MVMKLPWQRVEPLNAKLFAEVRHAAIFECCKWDPQVEDVCTLSPLPLVLTSDAWKELVLLAEKLARETIAAESAILQQPHLLKKLGLPRALRRLLSAPGFTAGKTHHPRLIRFDFHFTTAGWRISEANSDVPGGFNEASGFTKVMARHYGETDSPGDPVESMVSAIAKSSAHEGTVALAHATAFADDRQVMVFLARRLEKAGFKPRLVAPDHLRWDNGKAHIVTRWESCPVDFVHRFFPAEWLPSLPARCGWPRLLGSSLTPLCNPASAIISQSKRFPLVWDRLPMRLPAWEAMLPKTFDVRDLPRSNREADSFVLKPAFGRVGDMIRIRGVTPEKELKKIDRSIRRCPKMWIAQERFEAIPMSTVQGDVYPCIGIYTLDDEVIGAYGRIGRQPLINHLAQDAAVLIAAADPSLTDDQTNQHDTLRTLQTVGA
jgi:glutathionylspermidine synthase